MSVTIWDIETVPLPASELAAAIPPFNPEDVKYGNAKDPEKRAAILANAETRHREDFIRDAALDPRTGRIKAAGFRDVQLGRNAIIVWGDGINNGPVSHDPNTTISWHGSYAAFLSEISMRIMAAVPSRDQSLLGYYIHDFDLPFLFQSCWMHGVAVSPRRYRRGRYWNDNIIDIRQTWAMGERYAATGGLEGLCKLLKTPHQKTGDGKNFGALYEQDPKSAIDYLIGDLLAIEDAARAMGEL